MKGYLVIKNLKSNLEDVISEVPEKGIDYTLLVDVSLFEKRVKQVEVDDEDEDATFIFIPSGAMRLIKKEYGQDSPRITHNFDLKDGHIVEENPTE